MNIVRYVHITTTVIKDFRKSLTNRRQSAKYDHLKIFNNHVIRVLSKMSTYLWISRLEIDY